MVVIYDAPSKDGTIWSHHAFRVLFALHYKQIPYTFEGVEYPDINPTFEKTSLQPKPDPVEPYEIPVLKFTNSEGSYQYHMLTPDIIQALEDEQKDAPLLYSSPRSVEYRSRFGPALAPILQCVVGHVPGILSDRSIQYFKDKRKARWGKSVEQWITEHPINDGLAKATPLLQELGDWIQLNPGPFINGEMPSYADFTIASILAFVKAVGCSDLLESILACHPAIKTLYMAVAQTQKGNILCQNSF